MISLTLDKEYETTCDREYEAIKESISDDEKAKLAVYTVMCSSGDVFRTRDVDLASLVKKYYNEKTPYICFIAVDYDPYFEEDFRKDTELSALCNADLWKEFNMFNCHYYKIMCFNEEVVRTEKYFEARRIYEIFRKKGYANNLNISIDYAYGSEPSNEITWTYEDSGMTKLFKNIMEDVRADFEHDAKIITERICNSNKENEKSDEDSSVDLTDKTDTE